MSYRVEIARLVQRELRRWDLPESIWVDVYLYLREVLAASPTTHLRSGNFPFDGMHFEFSLIDRHERMRVHSFFFHVFYMTDEQTLLVADGAYMRREGI